MAESSETVRVPAWDFAPEYVRAALMRLGYLHPEWSIEFSPAQIEVAGATESAEQVRREVHYAIYREKILSETMDMRRSLLEAVSRR